jgi:hypothetical protein
MKCSRRPKIASSMFSSSEGSIGSAERAPGRPFRIFSSSEALGVRFRTHTEPSLNKVDEHKDEFEAMLEQISQRQR